MHEFRAPSGTQGHMAFVVMLVAGLAAGTPVLWVSPNPCVYPPGLAWLGLDPAQCLFARARDDAESLGTLEVALRGGMAGVAECTVLSRLAARRLALAARQGGSIGFLLRHAPAFTTMDSTSFAARWMITPVPADGPARLRGELLYAKGGRPGVFFFQIDQEANDGTTPPTLTLVTRTPELINGQRRTA